MLTAQEIAEILAGQFIDDDEDVLLLQPVEELPCIYDVLEAYLPEQAMGLEIIEVVVTVEATEDKVVISGYAAMFGLPPVRMTANFIVNDEEISLSILVAPEMGVTPAGLFPELSGSGLWLPLIDLKLEMKSNAENLGVIDISDGIINPVQDDLLAPLLPLLGELIELPRITGTAEVSAAGTVQQLRIQTPELKTITFGKVKLSGIRVALIAEENETGLLQATLLLEGKIKLDLDPIITVNFKLIPAPPDRPFHVLSAELNESDGQAVDAGGLGISMPSNLPKINIQSIQVLLGAVSGIPEDITIVAVMDEQDELEILPGLVIRKLGGLFTIWPTADPVSGRAELYGKVGLGGVDLNFTLEVPESEFSLELDPETAPNVKTMVHDLVDVELPSTFPDLDIDGFRISGNVDEKRYQFYFGLSGKWNFSDAISLQSISIDGHVSNPTSGTEYYGAIRGVLKLGDSEDQNAGLIQLSAELTSGGEWVLQGGLKSGSELSLPQLVSVVGINPDNIPGDLASLLITELNASFNTGSGEASFHAASGFSLTLPFGGGGLDLTGSISLARASSSDDWVGEAGGEVKFKTIRLKIAFPITNSANDSDMALKMGLWLPEPGNPDEGGWLKCKIDKDSEGSIEKLTMTLPEDINIFSAIERFINLMIPGFTIDFPYPWDELENLDLPETAIIINLGEKASVTLAITDGFTEINQFPGIDIKSIGLVYDIDNSKVAFNVIGKIFDSNYTEQEPLSWDPVTEDPPTPKIPDVGFELHYLGLGRHVALNNAASYERVGDAIEDLRHAFDNKPQEGSGALAPLTYSAESDWLIGFDFSAAGFIRMGVLFNDPLLYGLRISLDGPAAKALAGFEFEILYKRIAPGLGVYSMELELPSAIRTIELGAVTLTLPVIGVDIYTNGNFKLDLGFPYGANFDRSFYISVLPFTGAGGFYFASLNGATSTTVPKIINGEFDPVIEFGIGLRVGIGKKFGSGAFKAELSVTVLAILEGTFATFQPYDSNTSNALFYRVSGTFGIYAFLTGKVDFKVICVNFTAEIYLIAQVIVESYEPFFINARAGVRISARVKIGWFKITFRFSHEVTVSYTFGSRQATPWIRGNRALTNRLGRGDRKHKTPLPMTLGENNFENISFNWLDVSSGKIKEKISWHTYFGVSDNLECIDGDKESAIKHAPIATPLMGFAELSELASDQSPPVDFVLWLERVYDWLLCAWHSTMPEKIQFADVNKMNTALLEDMAADAIGWSELNTFLNENFSVTLKAQPPAEEGGEYKIALMPLPPALHIHFAVGKSTKDLDLSVEPVVAAQSLADIKERSVRYTPQPAGIQVGVTSVDENTDEEPDISAPMAEWLWKDTISLQIKELASRLLKLMEACPIKISGDYSSYTSIGDLYERLTYDPDPNDADRQPYFEDFVEANMGKTDILNEIEIIIPLESGDESYTVLEDDSIEKIANEFGLSPIELTLANLDSDLVRANSVWIIPAIKQLSPKDAWEKLTDMDALSDIAAMTSRFLLHGVRMPLEGEWKNLYQAGELQIDLPIAESEEANVSEVNLKFSHVTNENEAKWLVFENEAQATLELSNKLSSLEQSAQIIVETVAAIENAEIKTQVNEVVELIKVAIHADEISMALEHSDTLIQVSGSIEGNTQLDAEIELFLQIKMEVEAALQNIDAISYLDLKFTDSEIDALGKILQDVSFEPEAKVTGMVMTREEPLDFSLARAIPLQRIATEDGAVQTYARLRVLTASFFQYLERSEKEADLTQHNWRALRSRHSSAATTDNEVNLDFNWMARLDIEVLKLKKEAMVEGRSIYQISGLQPDAQLRLERMLSDIELGKITVNIAPTAGVAGPATSTGGLLVGNLEAKEIVLYRNDADERIDTPASADNLAPLNFLRLLAESLDEESGSFFFADVLPGIENVEERIFAGGEKGVITLLLFPEGEIDPARHADSIFLTDDQDKGAAPIRFTADNLSQKKARFEPDHLHFSVDRPEPVEESADALESLYSLLSFSFTDEDGTNASPPSLPIGPREVVEGVWHYEQIIPIGAAFAERQDNDPYSDVGKTRWLNLAWRDLFGNQACADDYGFEGRRTPVDPFEKDLNKIPLTCYYYDDIIPLNRWPGVQSSHQFEAAEGGAELKLKIKFDPSLMGEREELASDTESTKEELNRTIAQLQDPRLQTLIQTSLEQEPSQLTRAEWKNDILDFLHGVKAILVGADSLIPLEVSPGLNATMASFMQAHHLQVNEFARAIQLLRLNELFDLSDAIPLLRIPMKWQTGTDSINTIASASAITIDVLIESLLLMHEDERGLLREGKLDSLTDNKFVIISTDMSIADVAREFETTPANFLLDYSVTEQLLTPKKVIRIGDRSETFEAAESLGELSRRLSDAIESEFINSTAANGYPLAVDQIDIITANDSVKLQATTQLLLENRLLAPLNTTAGEAWQMSVLNSPVQVAKEMGLSLTDFVALNCRRADIIEANVEIILSITADKTISVTTVVDDSFDSLRKMFSALAGRIISSAEFAVLIGQFNILRANVYYLFPPAIVNISRTVTVRSTPSAFELNAQIILQRFPLEPSAEDLEYIHPELREKKAVWFVASNIAPSSSAADDQESQTTNLRPYAELFSNAFEQDSLHLGTGTHRRGTSDKPALWAVRLGEGGFQYEVEKDKPAFLSLRPLSTTPVNRKNVPVFKFVEDAVNLNIQAGDGAYELRNYSGIDFDEWAKQTLDILDRILQPGPALALSEIETTEAGNKYNHLLAARAKLASALTLGLTEIVDYPDGEPAKSDVTRRIMKERIGNRLASAYDIDTVAMFPLISAGESFEAKGSFSETWVAGKDTGYTLQSTSFTGDEKWMVMAVDVLKPEEHRTIDTRAAFQLNGLEFRNENNDEIVLSFVIPPEPLDLGDLVIPIPLRDMPEAPQLSRQQGIADFEMNAEGYPQIDSFDDLLAWRYELDFAAEFAEQDAHTLEIFFNLAAGEALPPMLGGYNGRLFEDLFHALAQCNATLGQYADILESRVEEKFKADEPERSDLRWIMDDLIVLVDELADHWREHYQRGGMLIPATLGETLQTSKHRYHFTEERVTEVNKQKQVIKDDLRYIFTCAPDDPIPLVRVDGITGEAGIPVIKTLPDGEKQAEITVTMPDWFVGRTSDALEQMPRTLGFQDLHILEKQNVRCRIKTTRNAELLPDANTAEAFIYRTPIVTLPDRFFPSVEMEKRVRISHLTKTQYNHPTEILADILQKMLGLERGVTNAGIKRRLVLSVRYGFAIVGDWSDPDSFPSETPIFFEPRFILDHVPDTSQGIDPNADDAVSRLGREMQDWMDNAGARRENAGFVIGVDVYTDETLNPALVEPNAEGRGAADDARLIRIMRLEVDFPGSKKPASEPELKKYYINKNAQANGDHEIHISDCQWFPASKNRVYIGEFSNCKEAVIEAKKKYSTADGCAHCLPGCHTS